jgi:transposase
VFTRIKGSPTTKKKYLQICRATYVNGRTSHKVIGSLGAVDELVESGEVEKLMLSLNQILSKYNSALPIQETLMPALKELKRYQWGAVKVIDKLWEIFELDSFIGSQKINAEFDFKNIVRLLVLDRFMNPRSKLKTYEHASEYFGIDNEEIELQHVYRSLDVLAKLKPNLEKHLFDINTNLFNMKVDVVFYDASTIYFQSQQKDELRDFGFSKDCKFNDVQVVIGLLMDQMGRPVGLEIFPGNTFDGHTVVQSLTSLKEKFNINKLIFVGDRGMCSEENLQAIAKAGYEYIVGMPIKRSSKALKEQVLDLDSYETIMIKDKDDNDQILKYKAIKQTSILCNRKDPDNKITVEEKIICTWTQSRAKKDAHDRDVLIEKAQEVLDGKSKLRKPGKAKYLALNEEVKYLDDAKILEDKKWDGIYAIRTNNTTLSQQEIYDQYRQLWKIEDCFRVMKSHLKIRPVYHWKPSRVTGHLVLCFLAFVFERHLEIELRKQKLQTSPARIREAISQMQASLVEVNQREYLMRSNLDTSAKQVLKTLNITVPQDLTLVNEF